MKMVIKELYPKLLSLVPIAHTSEKSYLDVLKESFDKLVQLINDLDDNDLHTPKDQILSSINDVYSNIESAVKYIYQGNHIEAYNSIDRALEKKEICFREFKCGMDYNFYRMRTLEDGKRFHREDMFHIPFNKRGLVSTQRYSMPGLPCLYLGFSLHACWEEMHRKPISTFAFNRFHLQQNIKVLSLDLPDKSRWGTDYEKVIQIFPMIMACMVEVDNYKNSFKSEYIIPQLLMEWITNHPKVAVDGICYTSVHKNLQFDFPQGVYNNLALPATDCENDKYSKHLKDLFTLTEPTTEEVERIKVGAFENIYTIHENEEDQLKENYRVSLFGSLESILCASYELKSL